MNAAAKTDLSHWFEKGRGFKKEGDLQNAIICFQTLLKAAPDDLPGLNELYKCCLLAKRQKEAIDTVNKLMRLYVQGQKKMEALMVYGELLQVEKAHCFDQAVQLQITDWLESVEDWGSAVHALENYGQRYPHDKRVPDLLLRAARLAQDRLHDGASVKRLTDWISEKYPDSKAAGEAALLFFSN